MSTTTSRLGSLKEHKLEQMLDRCRQTSLSISEPEATRAIGELVNATAASSTPLPSPELSGHGAPLVAGC